MDIINIKIEDLQISDINVRKNLISNIEELAESINKNGLINPITVKLNSNGKYDIIAGQRRFLAMKSLNRDYISCNLININDDAALEVSIIENIQKHNLSTCDKVLSYSKLCDINDTDKVIEMTKISKPTLKKYLKIKDLPLEVLKKLDEQDKSKITVPIAVEFTNFPKKINLMEIIDKLATFKTKTKMELIKKIKENEYNEIDDIISDYNEEDKVDNKRPYVFDSVSQKNLLIPEELYSDVIQLIKKEVDEDDLTYF
jgi:ParB family chromosome partitioning protein